MRAFLFLLCLFITACAQRRSHYEIVHKEVHIKNAIHTYPQVTKSGTHSSTLDSLNKMLNHFGELKYYLKRNTNKIFVSSTYKTKLHNDSLISFEFSTIEQGDNMNSDTIYRGLTLNTHKLESSFFESILSEPDQVYPTISRDKLAPYIKKVDSNMNLLAYERDSRYLICWALERDCLIVYIGGEGEGFGYHKVRIPLKELH